MPFLSQDYYRIRPSLFILLLSVAGLYTLVRVNSFSSKSTNPLMGQQEQLSMGSSSTSNSSPMHWKPLEPKSFPSVVSSDDGSRLAKDEEYLAAVLTSWKDDHPMVETTPWIYYDEDETPLYGHIVRPVESSHNRPGVFFFHTAAGPQDVFLFQKAATLASSELGCVVFVCDVFSDPDGWAWSPDGDRTRFQQVKTDLLKNNARLLRSRVKAAIDASLEQDVDPQRLAALGWCFGAQPILEVAALQNEQEGSYTVSALISYHGVYAREEQDVPTRSSHQEEAAIERDVLICTGNDDPFVAPEDLEFAQKVLHEKGYRVTTLALDGAKHGFTNPAQDFNSNPAFQYNEEAAKTSWAATMDLLSRRLLK